ncbi:hypothetical protein JRO89_XS02G0231800 [Xanthoceras sorbifolium]|uniref:Uncharacterized protein n=1 Tax=Xanthoceras sorbifolium TaxID=99658 RepID=A0ABQ8IGP6_9ROSI|nr:hypothetical protein JRO89_XS02G0231800 [Xanthoceras sorbifolium]
MAAETSRSVKVIVQSKVAPPPGSVSTTTVVLTFIDVRCLFIGNTQRIFFYELPHPTLHFTQTILPRLKQSISLSLRHFFPLASNLLCPPPPHEPYILYDENNGSVQVTTVESDADFNHSVANHARDVKALKSLAPKLPLYCLSSSSNTTHLVPIMRAGGGPGGTPWAQLILGDIIEDPDGLSSIYLEELRTLHNLNPIGDNQVSPDNFLITLVLKQTKIKQLKHWIATADGQQQYETYDEEIRISTFAVACAFMWVNLMKLREQIRGSLDDDDDMLYHFLAPADCRE